MKPDEPAPKKSPEAPRATRVLRVGLRIACIALIIWGGWSIVQSIMILFQTPRSMEEIPHEEPVAANEPLLDALESTRTDVARGFWESAGARWKIGQAQLSTHELDARIGQLGSLHGSSGVVANDDEKRLLELLPKLDFQRVERSGGFAYALNNDKCRIYLVTDANAGTEVIAGGLGAFRVQPDEWTIIEIQQAAEAGRSKAGAEVVHLLPLPETAKRQIARVAEDGGLQVEVLTVRGLNFELTDSWKSAGWAIADSPNRVAGDFNFICEREGTVIHAWAPGFDRSSGVLVLVKATAGRTAEGAVPKSP